MEPFTANRLDPASERLTILSRRNGRDDLNRGGERVEWMMVHSLLSAWKIHYFLLYQMRSIKSIALSIRFWCGLCFSPWRIECSIIVAPAGSCTMHPSSNKGQIIFNFKVNFAMLRHSSPPRMQGKDEVGTFHVCHASCGFRRRFDKNRE